jgi:hypothetical protein
VRASLANLHFVKWRLVLRLSVRAIILIMGAYYLEWTPFGCDGAYSIYLVAPVLVRLSAPTRILELNSL